MAKHYYTRLLNYICIIVAVTIAALASAAEITYPPRQQWSWTGPLGTYDKASAQRGLQVFVEVCHVCHGLSLVPMRELSRLGYSENQIKAFAKKYEVMSGFDSSGELQMRVALPADPLPSPYKSEAEAREANNGAYPPDLSLIIDSRAVGRGNMLENFIDAITAQDNASGADYLYALMVGYQKAPSNIDVLDGMHYNKWYAGNQIAMPQPIYEDSVEYSDGTKASIEQQAKDVATFLAWASEPNLEERRSMGVKVMSFLIIFIILLYITKRRIWKNIH